MTNAREEMPLLALLASLSACSAPAEAAELDSRQQVLVSRQQVLAARTGAELWRAALGPHPLGGVERPPTLPAL